VENPFAIPEASKFGARMEKIAGFGTIYIIKVL